MGELTMTSSLDEPDQLRSALEDAQRQQERDCAIIVALRKEVSDHRREGQRQVQNILSVVRSIARRTVEEGETAEEYQARLDSRLASFTNLQSQIVCDPTRGVDLCTLVDNELLAFGIKLDDQAHADGPPLRLKPKPASILGLAFHELARMAIEDGSSANLDGQINVRCLLERDGAEPAYIEIVWLETGRQKHDRQKPDPTFGREVVEQAVTYKVGGDVQLDVTEDGLNCQFRLPVDCLAEGGGKASGQA